MHFKRSALAIIVTAAITTPHSALAATEFNSVSDSIQSIAVKPAQQAKTVSGMKNQIDAISNQTTFAWAPEGLTVPNLSAVAPEHQIEVAASHYLNSLTGAISKGSLNQLKPVLVSSYQGDDGVKIAKFRQDYQGVEVFNREYNILMDAEFNLVAGSGTLASASATKSAAFTQFSNADTAILNAFSAAGGDQQQISLTTLESADAYQVFTAENQKSSVRLLGEPRAKAVYFEQKQKLVPAHYVEIEVAAEGSVESDYYSYVISSETGEVLFKNNLKAHAADFQYRVYAGQDGTPWDGPHGNVVPATSADQVDATAYLAAPLVKLSHGPISTKDGWLDVAATTTSGNNVTAYADVVAPDGLTDGDYAAETTAAGIFDYKYRTSEPETSLNNRKAAIVNLFYMNNYLHDLFYDYGFDEKSGNAQLVNFGRGGVEGDPLKAEVQDNSGFNNANMSTPADGRSPRMQMYLWDSKDATFGEDYGLTATASGESISITALQRSSFGQGQFNISGQLVVLDDGIAPTRDGCTAAVNGASLVGKIAIVDRGTCPFTEKVKQAQNAGAIAVIVVNNAAAGLPGMGGSDPVVKIPNVGISLADGNKLYAAIAAGKTVELNLFNSRPFKDSSWDNAIVSHEWGHYISNRLVGNGNGLYNNQGRSMGEGWGDFHALLTVSEAKDLELPGNDKLQRAYAAISYVDSFYYGIRSVPYSQDREVNEKTFRFIEVGRGVFVDQTTGAAQVHSAGEVWATMLWDGFVNLVNDDRHSFNEAKHRMMGYLVNGYKMTPVGPTYTEARDAILAAAYAKDPADYKLLLKAFADRGMGLGAKAPNRDDPQHKGVVESTKTELNTFDVSGHSINRNYEGLTAGFCTNNGILDNGETGTISFNITNRGDKALSNIKAKVEVTSGQNVTFANNGEITLPNVGVFKTASTTPLEFKLEGATVADEVSFKLSFPGLAEDVVTAEYSLSDLVNLNFKDRAPVNQESLDDMEDYASLNNFKEVVLVGGDLAKNSRAMDGTNAAFFASRGHQVGSQYMHIANNGFTSDVAYETKAFDLGYGADFKLSFWHYYNFETNYDGGVVEISINGGAWKDVTKVQVGTSAGQPVYAKFDGGYDNELEELLPGRKAFTGPLNENFGANESINFGAALNGNSVKFRFRAVSDSNSNSDGWFIDNVKVQNITTSVFSDVVAGNSLPCDNRTPVITKTSSSVAEVNEGAEVKLTVAAQDANAADKLTYSWKQLSGTTAVISNGSTAEATVKTPLISAASETLNFEVTVSDGKVSVKSTVGVKVNNIPDPAPPISTNRSPKGGSLGWFALILVPFALLRRRKS
ncbi:GlyGly-CTERM sorting domain-containing protein [Rheinheimera riviphila]|uniref:GlyGly-CTERM sorting domain-containing protein n=2 Tax=Rheinheimera riviphila TaxID=1834037 RepID=A0A437QZV4_9GAMM|nr:GlyGly-CTERM sorting domain-containing protein [Rheinheimera riviphila]